MEPFVAILVCSLDPDGSAKRRDPSACNDPLSLCQLLHNILCVEAQDVACPILYILACPGVTKLQKILETRYLHFSVKHGKKAQSVCLI